MTPELETWLKVEVNEKFIRDYLNCTLAGNLARLSQENLTFQYM